jgi:hypothetical protein
MTMQTPSPDKIILFSYLSMRKSPPVHYYDAFLGRPTPRLGMDCSWQGVELGGSVECNDIPPPRSQYVSPIKNKEDIS